MKYIFLLVLCSASFTYGMSECDKARVRKSTNENLRQSWRKPTESEESREAMLARMEFGFLLLGEDMPITSMSSIQVLKERGLMNEKNQIHPDILEAFGLKN